MYAKTEKMTNVRKITILGTLAAIAYVVMVVGRIPIVAFLKYDPKDVIIAFAGLIYGPMSAFIISLVVSLVEMITVSDTGPIGLIMNVLGTAAFACTAAAIYRKRQTLKGAVIGLIAGCVMMTLVMMLWNYLITPFYMNVPREKVVEMLLPAFLPFNLLKSSINAALTLLLYKPLVGALRGARLLPTREEQTVTAVSKQATIGVWIAAAAVLVTCILVILVFQGVI